MAKCYKSRNKLKTEKSEMQIPSERRSNDDDNDNKELYLLCVEQFGFVWQLKSN